MTKAGGFAGWAGRDRVTDFDLTVGDDDPHDQPLDQLSLLLPGRLFEPLSDAPAELVHAQGETRKLGLAVDLRVQLLPPCGEASCLVLQVMAPPTVFLQAEDAGQIGLGEPLDLPLHTGMPARQSR